MSEFVKGDTVQLKSGGAVMTVVTVGDSLAETNQVWTVWFDGMDKHEGQFPAEALVKTEPPMTKVELV